MILKSSVQQTEWCSRGTGNVCFTPFTALYLAHCLILEKKKKGNCLASHRILCYLLGIDNIIAFKAANEPLDIMPILLILKGVIYEDEVQKLMK